MKRVLVISPHLDDAVLSAGQFIAGRNGNVDVFTVFSGIPMADGLTTPYDESCGFNNSKDAMVVRRQEDQEALAILNAKPIFSDRLDSQYKKEGDYDKLMRDLRNLVEATKYELVVAPFGLKHPDHIAVSDSIVGLRLPNLYLYEDIPARVTDPELVFERLKQFPTARLTFIGDGAIADKVRALWCYNSQIGRGDLNPYNLYVPERFWHVA